MIVYWSMFAFPALFAMVSESDAAKRNIVQRLGLTLIFLAFVLVIGLRHEVGADWFNYELIVEYIALSDFTEALSFSDPAFAAVAWVSSRFGVEVYGPSFVSGLMLMIGVIRFCRRQSDSWLALAASVPYLLIVVGMGYVRQGAAIGLLLIAILHFERNAIVRAGVWLATAAAFHVSALVLAPILAVVQTRRQPLLLIPTALVGAILAFVLLRERVSTFLELYIETLQYDSSGTLVRLAMNAVPSVIFLLFSRRFGLNPRMTVFWTLMSLASLALVPAFLVSPSTTIIDRIGLYFIPIQLLVFGNLPSAFARTSTGRSVVVAGTLGYYAAVLFVWLNFAIHAEYWLPYSLLGYEVD